MQEDRLDMRDLRWGVYVILIALLVGVGIGMGAGKAMACDSYEDCMRFVDAPSDRIVGIMSGDVSIVARTPSGFTTEGMSGYRTEYKYDKFLLKAIAFKLGEISQKLGPDPEELAKVIALIHKEGGLVKGIDKEVD